MQLELEKRRLQPRGWWVPALLSAPKRYILQACQTVRCGSRAGGKYAGLHLCKHRRNLIQNFSDPVSENQADQNRAVPYCYSVSGSQRPNLALILPSDAGRYFETDAW